MKKILVTGGAGFVGRHIIERHLKLGNEVHCVDNLSLFTGAKDPKMVGPYTILKIIEHFIFIMRTAEIILKKIHQPILIMFFILLQW